MKSWGEQLILKQKYKLFLSYTYAYTYVSNFSLKNLIKTSKILYVIIILFLVLVNSHFLLHKLTFF
jgi:hypothetical protein